MARCTGALIARLLPGALGARALLACGPTAPGADAGVDAGHVGVDAYVPPLELAFEPVVSRPGPVPGSLTEVSDGLVRLYDGFLEHSADGGRTWTLRAPTSAASLAYEPSRDLLFASSRTGVERSRDGGRTFEPLDAPVTERVVAHVTTDGALWLEQGGVSPRLFRSTDGGESFVEVALPTVDDFLIVFTGLDGSLFLAVDDRVVYRTRDGSRWEELATVSAARVFSTRSGTVLISGSDGATTLELRAEDGVTFERTSAEATYRYAQRPNGRLVRVALDGRTDESSDEGRSWTRIAPALTVVFLDLVARDEALLASTSQGPARLTGPAWRLEDPPGLPPNATAEYLDVSFARSGAAALVRREPSRSVVYLSDATATRWRRLTTMDSAGVSAVAMRPDGERVFLGMTLGRYAVLDTRGFPHLEGGIVARRETVRQAQWVEESGIAILYATLASDDDLSGVVVMGRLTDETAPWMELHPAREGLMVTAPPTLGYHGIAFHTGFNDVMLVSSRRFIGTNAYETSLWVNLDFNSLTGSWGPQRAPLPRLVRTLGPAGAYGDAVAALFEDGELAILSLAGPRWVALSPSIPPIHSAKIAPDRHVWLATRAGAFRSVDPLP
jgi:hypothetical protein